MKAIIIGGSVGGLMAALLLRNGGWDVTVYERGVGDLAGRGAGLGVSDELLDVMARAGAPFERSAGIAQSAHVGMEKDGSIAYEHRRNLMASAWARVYQPLRAALPPSSYRQAMTRNAWTVIRRCLPTARATRPTSSSAPTACTPLCASNSCPTCSRRSQTTSRGAASSRRKRCRPRRSRR